MKYGIVASIVCLLAGWALHGAIDSVAPSNLTEGPSITLGADDANAVMKFVGRSESDVDELTNHLDNLFKGNEEVLESMHDIKPLMKDYTTLVAKAKQQCKAVLESARVILHGDDTVLAQDRMAKELTVLIAYSARCADLNESLSESLTKETARLQAALDKQRRGTSVDAAATLKKLDERHRTIEPGLFRVREVIAGISNNLAAHPELAAAVAEYETAEAAYHVRYRFTRDAALRIMDGNSSAAARNDLTTQLSELEATYDHLLAAGQNLVDEMTAGASQK